MDKNVYELSLLRYSDLVSDYVAVCNEALHQNSHRFPFKQILGAAKESVQAQQVEVNILDWGHKESYVFRLGKKGIKAFPHGTCEDCDCVRSWGVSRDYLEQVASAPSDYIANPAKLNWDWMYDK